MLLDEAAVEDADLARPRQVLELVEEAALPHPGVAADHHELALAAQRRVEPLLQLVHLGLASGERRQHGARRRHRRRQQQRLQPLTVAQLGAVGAQRARQLAGRRRPPRRVLGEAGEHQALELGVDLDAALARRLRVLVHHAVEHGLHLARERHLADQALVQHAPQRVEVGAPVDATGRHLLGTDVRHGAEQHPALGQAGHGVAARQAEVHDAQPHLAARLDRHHDVLGLDVAVHDGARVAVVERLGDTDADVDHGAERERALAQQRPQVLADHHRHDEEQRPLVAPEVVDRDDRRVVHLRDELRLALETRLRLRRQQRRRHHLDRHLAVEQRVARPVHDPHAAAPELGEHLVAVGKPFTEH